MAVSAATPEHDSSPRTRRYFTMYLAAPYVGRLFSAHAEVFPWSPVAMTTAGTLLRARGGISAPNDLDTIYELSSPRTRRYFRQHRPNGRRVRLFSAHAEVFPKFMQSLTGQHALLRARGGIS